MTALPFIRLPRRLGVAGATAALVGSLFVVGAAPAVADPVHTPVLGAGKVQADFNGDGYSELAIADSTANVGTVNQAGEVYVIPGSATG